MTNNNSQSFIMQDAKSGGFTGELSAVTYDDILNDKALYERILTLPDEFAVYPCV